MGSWGITERQSDYGLDLLGTIIDKQLKQTDFSIFNVAEALELIKADILEEIRYGNRGCPAENLTFYICANFCKYFTHGALLIAECLADYYRTGELAVTEYVGEMYNPVEHSPCFSLSGILPRYQLLSCEFWVKKWVFKVFEGLPL